ncbi:MAG: hypothetical protein IJK03_09185 [Oscillospiraceae bacterium]|nr:hypothetical protein [Oscillospiraceae bacterium]MBQ6428936.1 hypothetical protein [Oscillospiraceae bacterium]
MTGRDEMLGILRNLSLDRTAVRLMQEDVTRIAEEEKQKELPAVKRKALEKERVRLESCLTVTANHISRIERLLGLLAPEERKVLDWTLVNPRPDAVFDLAEEFRCDASSVYRLRARAVSKLVRLRFGVGE